MKRFGKSGKSFLAVGLAAGLSLAAFGRAAAITGGEADGEQHPNVGLIVFYDADGRFRCTATLVTPTVLLTAAHCTIGTLGKTLVTFDTDPRVAASDPGLPVANDVTLGYDGTEGAGDPRSFYFGTAHTPPQYSEFTDTANWNDYAVVVLDRPVTGITPATLAPVGYLDQLKQSQLNKTLFELVGYGTEVRKPDSGPQKPTPQGLPLIRRTTTSPGQKLTPQILQMQGNPADTRGGGGTCFGDSGGPSFLNGYLVTVTSYGYTSNCRYLGGYQRVDIAVAQNWLAQFLTNM